MKNFKSMAAGLSMAVAALALTTTPAHAVLIELDLNAAGDKLITLDTVTGLEWLDVNATLGLSYNAAEATAFVTAQGFSHANTTDVSTLFTNTGVTDQTGAFTTGNFPGAVELLAKLGCTNACGSPAPSVNGFADLTPFDAALATFPLVRPDFISLVGRSFVFTGLGTSSKSDAFPILGNFLHRSPISPIAVPEPSTWAIMIAGLIGLSVCRRRRGNGS